MNQLQQNKTWTNHLGEEIQIADMDESYRSNVRNFLLRRAASLEMFDSLQQLVIISGITGEQARWSTEDAFFNEQEERMSDPEGWLRSTPLFGALMGGVEAHE